ncbi:MAG: hypothetical protein ABSF55_02295 [Candidatus Staskawiczbacteria bacterium]
MMSAYKKLFWTEHSKIKMRQYGFSKQKLLGILYRPERKEKGIAPGTLAVMKTNKRFENKTIPLLKTKWKPKKVPGEIWIMYKDTKDFRKIISAWRYPGISKPGEEIPIPDDIRRELENNYGNK